MPDALEWTWSNAKPLYLGPAPRICRGSATRDRPSRGAVLFLRHARRCRILSNDDVAKIRDILDSYQYSNALALVVLSALVMHFEPIQQETVRPLDGAPRPLAVKLPELQPTQSLKPEVVRMIEELNGFGEETDKSLIASMYRHLSYWPTYLSLVRTMLVPLETNGQLHALTPSTRALARSHGRALAQLLRLSTPPDTVQQTLAACRRFVNYPMGLKRLANWRLDMRRTSCSCGWTVPTSSRCALR